MHPHQRELDWSALCRCTWHGGTHAWLSPAQHRPETTVGLPCGQELCPVPYRQEKGLPDHCHPPCFLFKYMHVTEQTYPLVTVSPWHSAVWFPSYLHVAVCCVIFFKWHSTMQTLQHAHILTINARTQVLSVWTPLNDWSRCLKQGCKPHFCWT
jgi:hypothetical protein